MDAPKIWTIEENRPDKVYYLYDLSELDSPNTSLRINHDKEKGKVSILYRNPDYQETVHISEKISASHLDMEAQIGDETLTHDPGAPKIRQYEEILKRLPKEHFNKIVEGKLELLFNDSNW